MLEVFLCWWCCYNYKETNTINRVLLVTFSLGFSPYNVIRGGYIFW